MAIRLTYGTDSSALLAALADQVRSENAMARRIGSLQPLNVNQLAETVRQQHRDWTDAYVAVYQAQMGVMAAAARASGSQSQNSIEDQQDMLRDQRSFESREAERERKSREGITQAQIASREKIARDQIASREVIAGLRAGFSGGLGMPASAQQQQLSPTNQRLFFTKALEDLQAPIRQSNIRIEREIRNIDDALSSSFMSNARRNELQNRRQALLREREQNEARLVSPDLTKAAQERAQSLAEAALSLGMRDQQGLAGQSPAYMDVSVDDLLRQINNVDASILSEEDRSVVEALQRQARRIWDTTSLTDERKAAQLGDIQQRIARRVTTARPAPPPPSTQQQIQSDVLPLESGGMIIRQPSGELQFVNAPKDALAFMKKQTAENVVAAMTAGDEPATQRALAEAITVRLLEDPASMAQVLTTATQTPSAPRGGPAGSSGQTARPQPRPDERQQSRQPSATTELGSLRGEQFQVANKLREIGVAVAPPTPTSPARVESPVWRRMFAEEGLDADQTLDPAAIARVVQNRIGRVSEMTPAELAAMSQMVAVLRGMASESIPYSDIQRAMITSSSLPPGTTAEAFGAPPAAPTPDELSAFGIR